MSTKASILLVALVVAGCQKVEKVDVAPPTVLFTAAGQSSALIATPLDAEGRPVDKVDVKFTTSDALIATVDAMGKVTAVKSGAATITAQAGEKSGSARVDVRIPAKITLTPAPIVLTGLGSTAMVEARVDDELDRQVEGATVALSVAAPDVATVTDKTVTAVAAGTTRLVASFGPVTREVEVTVKLPEFASLVLEPTAASVKLGEATNLTATAKDAAGAAVGGVPFAYATSDEKIATVDAAGKVTPVAAGKATITVTSGDKTATAEVTVTK